MFDFYADTEVRATMLSKLHQSGKVLDFEVILKNGDGSLISVFHFRDDPILCFGTTGKNHRESTDISERKQTEIALR